MKTSLLAVDFVLIGRSIGVSSGHFGALIGEEHGERIVTVYLEFRLSRIILLTDNTLQLSNLIINYNQGLDFFCTLKESENKIHST